MRVPKKTLKQTESGFDQNGFGQPEKQSKISEYNEELVEYSPEAINSPFGLPSAPQRADLVVKGPYLTSFALYVLIVH